MIVPIWSISVLAVFSVMCAKGKVFDAIYTCPPDEVIVHQAIDLKSGKVYLGCKNKLYQLNSDLEFEWENVTGPIDDVDNENKALLILNEEDSLITCGTRNSGTCEMRSLSNISQSTAYRNNRIFYGSRTESYAFVAPAGPFGGSSKPSEMAMYVGSFGSDDPRPPLMSTRRLQNPGLNTPRFSVFETKPVEKTSMYLGTKFTDKDKYDIRYVSGFSHQGFSYFLSVQSLDGNKRKYESKIIRICQKDSGYESYIEMPIRCTVGTRNYNFIRDAFVTESGSYLARSMNISTNESILYAVFTNSLSPDSSSTAPQSAVCVYSLREIRRTLFNATKACWFEGKGTTVPYIREGTAQCDIYMVEITENYCGKGAISVSLNYPLQGIGDIEAQPLMEFDDYLTAIAVTDVNNYTIAFLGSSKGFLKKITIESPVHGREYENEAIHDGFQVGKDILFDKNKTHLYVTAGSKVVKMRLTDCSRHTTCDTCLESGDPYCGWCSLEKKCSRKSSCSNSDMPLRWLGLGTSHCIEVTSMTPQNTSLDQRATIWMNITNMPQFHDQPTQYYCIFGDDKTQYRATVAAISGLYCRTPPIDRIPALVEKDFVKVRLKIRSNVTGVDFLETDFNFYKCQTHSLCGKCVLTQWPCNWCVYDNLCTHDTAQCSKGSAGFIYSKNYPYIAQRGGKDHCPQLIADNSSEILLPNGLKKEITVKGKNLPDPGEGYFQCVVRQGDSQEIRQRAVRRSNETVVCQREKPYSYKEDDEYLKVNLTIAWRRDGHKDSQYFDSDITVTMYKCEKMGPDCSRCTSPHKIDPKYSCGWCPQTSECAFNQTCQSPNEMVKCAQPSIKSFYPKSGPIEGGTNLTIIGTDLGKTFEDINGTNALIQVAGRPCTPYREFYVIASKIVCQISERPKEVPSNDGPVTIRLQNGQHGKSNGDWFKCRDPQLKKIDPTLGPKSGLSKIKITGKYLDTGVREATRAFIGSYPCEINESSSISSNEIICYSSPVNSSMTVSNVSVMFDGHARRKEATFTYTEDPTIASIGPLTSIKSGGIPVTVTGTNFKSIQRPLMFVRSGKWLSEETDCEVKSDTMMICPAPNVTDDFPVKRIYRAERATTAKVIYLNVGFKMDGVQSVQTINESFPTVDHTIKYTVDPYYSPFEGGVKNYVPGESSRLIIEGENLKVGNSVKDVTVMIGNEKCNITSLAPTELSCIPPEHQPAGVTAEKLPIVNVSVGNLHFPLGYLLYKVDSDINFPPLAIYAIAGAAGLLLLIIIVILIICKRKSTKHEREFKHLQIQLDTWESNVREECKQGFAELQTDMTDLTSDLNASGIPFWSYQMYTFRVLFPGLKDHPILHKTEARGPKTVIEQAMTQFNQLVINKNFLLTLIRTLEEQKGFSIRDKANVASLLTIILQDKMEYSTEIVKVLLNELIDKYVEKKQAKLLLRRTESVVEKLLANWLSICLYENLKEDTGKPLFMLFKAIKTQVEKGPVDAVTADARYSLSEDRLLREKTQQNSVNLNIVLDDGEIMQCKVLLCDTITQVKEKMLDTIYKNTPFSHRPSVYDLDLEWRSGRLGQGHLCLQDDDVTSNQDPTGWKKINTLDHYKVPDDAQMALVPKQHDSLGRSTCNGGTGGLNGNLAISLTSMTPILQDIESGAKIYHLVKQLDFDSSGKERSHKVITEIFLPRLLSTKGTLQTFVDDLFKTILSVDDQLPTAIKYLFDFLDEAAARHSIIDQEVIYTWKSNSLPLRFWVNIIKNPNFVFDVHKPAIVDSCLSVIAQTFMDSCSTTEHRLGKDSPTNKLLYAKDIPNYKKMVNQYYQNIQSLSPVSDQDMKIYLGELSKVHPAEINVTVALKDLYEYVAKYKAEVQDAIEDNPLMTKESNKLSQIISAMDSTESIA